MRDKIALFCNIPPENAIPNRTAPILYEVPLMPGLRKFAGVCVRHPGHMPGKLHHRHLHPKADAQEGDSLLPAT